MPQQAALALWRDDTTYTNGGYFERIPARGARQPESFLSRPPDQGDAEPLARQHRLRVRDHETTAYKSERVRGWCEHETCPPRARTDTWDERRAQVLYRQRPGGGERLVLVDVVRDPDTGAVASTIPLAGVRPTPEKSPPRAQRW